MRSEEVRENVELEDDWELRRMHPSRAWASGARRTEGRMAGRRNRILAVLVAGLPVHMVVVKVLYELYRHLARAGLSYFEIVFLVSALWLVAYLYLRAVGQAR